MSRDVTKSGGGGLLAVPRISPELRKLLNHREVIASYGDGTGLDGGGEFRRGKWVKPDFVDLREREEAVKALPTFERLAGPAPRQWVLDFLNFLWESTRHNSDQTWESVQVVYPRMLRNYPAYCWREDRFDLLPHAFPTWFPTVGELALFFETDRVWIEDEIVGLRGVAEAPVGAPGSGSRKWGPEAEAAQRAKNQEKADLERKELARIAAEKYGDPPVPERVPGESDDLFLARLKQHRAEVERRATRDMKRPYSAIKRMNDKPAPPPTPETMKRAYDATGIKPQGFDPPESTVSEQPDAERLGDMPPDYTTPEEL